jgi:hypothetical protein
VQNQLRKSDSMPGLRWDMLGVTCGHFSPVGGYVRTF